MTDLLPANAADMEAAAQFAYEVDKRIRQTVRAMKSMWVDLAAELYRFNRSGMWRDIGYDTFEEYLEQPELEIKRRWAYSLIAMYEQLVIDRGVLVEDLKKLNVSKVAEVLPAVRRGRVTLEQAFSDVETLARGDLQVRYRGLATMPERAINPAEERVTRGPVPAEALEPPSGDAMTAPPRRTCPECGGRGSVLV